MLDFFARACRLRILGPPTLQEARAVPRPEPVSSQDDFSTTLHWGPVPSFASRLAGGRFPTSSLMLVPYIPEPVRIAALNEIPKDVLPCEGDTVRSLVARLSRSSFLEDSHVLRGGKGPGRVRLNSTSYPQPRRRSWSVVVEPPHEDADGDHISILFNYTAYGRLPSVQRPGSRREVGFIQVQLCGNNLCPFWGCCAETKHPPVLRARTRPRTRASG